MYKLFIQGIVQGVGFRPYIYKIATNHNLVGSIRNTGNGVEIIINDKHFTQKLTNLPPLAKIQQYTITPYTPKKTYTDFTILPSTYSQGETSLPADIFTCPDCLKELKTKENRRYNYYFITCTNCGPRFSMIEDYPYDRPYTSMNDFPMCPQCKKEYTNPLDRRYHAQTIACKHCGPKLHLYKVHNDISGKTDFDTIKKACILLKKGETIAIKGVGGFHLCSLTTEKSVTNVRNLLHRNHKPFAILVKDIAMAQTITIPNKKEQQLLQNPTRPIVVIKKKHNKDFHQVSELDTIGIILPYTALHYLLFDFIDTPLLLTSCNIPGEPVATTETIGAYFLTHDRHIINRCDDSVLKVINTKTFYLRRSRGYTPLPVPLPINCKDTIAVGAELNNVICTAKKHNCYLSQYIGETSKYETYQFLKDTIATFIKLTRLKPRIIACDLHPTYNSTHLAHELAEHYQAKLIKLQHHKVHVASVAAEHNLTDYIGIALDGIGYGDDGTIWGGEIFKVTNNTKFTRIGHLEQQPMIGGDSATIYPKKMLLGILSKIYTPSELINLHLFTEKETSIYLDILHKNINVQYGSSTGRVLDATAALLGICDERTYDGRPAMMLESVATQPLDFTPIIKNEKRQQILMTTPLIDYIFRNIKSNKGRLAATAQMYLAKGLLTIAQNASEDHVPIVLSGGVAYNRMISGYMMKNQVLVNKDIPSGDGGICYGQAYLANLLEKEK